MSSLIREVLGTLATLLSTELNSLASGSTVISSVLNGTGVYNNTQGSGSSSTTGDGYGRGYLLFTPGGVFGGSLAANAALQIWFLKSLDGGTIFESGSSSQPPTRPADANLPLNSGSTAAADNTPDLLAFLPACYFKICLTNASGQALAATTNTLKLLPATDQVG